MIQLHRLLCGALIGLLRSSARREAEILILRHQINVLRRKSPDRPALSNVDRFVFGERHLRHLLESYQRYYNEARTHLSLSKDAPTPRAVQALGSITSKPFHHQYVRI
jgi:hypothetical protein